MENTSALAGKRIALLEARMGSELANLITRHGGAPVLAPALREVSVAAAPAVAALIDQLQTDEIAFVILQTGVGVAGLLNEAEKLNRKDELIALLQTVATIVRGPKPTAVLARNNIKPKLITQEPHTTADLLALLYEIEVREKGVAVIHYGERNQALTESLQTRGAKLHELCLYEWQMPEDITPLQNLIGEIVTGNIDAVAFTSQVQARHLFQVAEKNNNADELRAALNTKTIVASIGPTCTEALKTLGIIPALEPEHPKMGFLVMALQQHFAQ